jgi:hypothetical protein
MDGVAVKLEDLNCGNSSWFYFLFRPVFEDLHNFYWARIIGDNFSIPLDWFDDEDEAKDDFRLKMIFNEYVARMDFTELLSSDDGPGEFAAILDIGYIVKYSRYFSDNWDQIFLFDKNDSECSELMLKYLTNRIPYETVDPLIDEKVKVVFHNYDGAFWEFYTSCKATMKRLVCHLEAIEGIEYRRLDFPGLAELDDASGEYLTKIGW